VRVRGTRWVSPLTRSKALKFEGDYTPNAKSKIFARGLSAIRRDNAKLVQQTVLDVMDMLFQKMAPRNDIVAFCGAAFAAIHNSAVLVHTDRSFPGRLPFESFIQSAGISKHIDSYDGDNSATAVAKQMLAANPQCGIGKNSRVTFVVTVQGRGAKRSEQALLPSACRETRTPLDANFYTTALLKKLSPLLSVLFMDDDRASRRTRTLTGAIVELAPQSAAERARLLGESMAERAILEAFRKQKLFEAPQVIRPTPPCGADGSAAAKRKAPEAGQRSLASFFKK
jgi:hypothetical protein